MNKKISTVFAIIVTLLVGSLVSFLLIQAMNQNNIPDVSNVNGIKNKNNEMKACTVEAKQCLDGSYVSRTGPNCEFATCPETNMVGNDKDKYGCIGSAGYSWCEEKQKCLRNWEEKCEK